MQPVSLAWPLAVPWKACTSDLQVLRRSKVGTSSTSAARDCATTVAAPTAASTAILVMFNLRQAAFPQENWERLVHDVLPFVSQPCEDDSRRAAAANLKADCLRCGLRNRVGP